MIKGEERKRLTHAVMAPVAFRSKKEINLVTRVVIDCYRGSVSTLSSRAILRPPPCRLLSLPLRVEVSIPTGIGRWPSG